MVEWSRPKYFTRLVYPTTTQVSSGSITITEDNLPNRRIRLNSLSSYVQGAPFLMLTRFRYIRTEGGTDYYHVLRPIKVDMSESKWSGPQEIIADKIEASIISPDLLTTRLCYFVGSYQNVLGE